MANYNLSIVAENDLIRIYQYGVLNFGQRQAEKYFHAFFDCFNIISQNPFSFESIDFIKPGYRRCVCGSDSIYFRVNNDKVEIMTIEKSLSQ